MKNTTISLEDNILEKAKQVANSMGISFNAYIKMLIESSIQNSPKHIVEELVELSKKIQGNSNGEKWTKDDIYER